MIRRAASFLTGFPENYSIEAADVANFSSLSETARQIAAAAARPDSVARLFCRRRKINQPLRA